MFDLQNFLAVSTVSMFVVDMISGMFRKSALIINSLFMSGEIFEK